MYVCQKEVRMGPHAYTIILINSCNSFAFCFHHSLNQSMNESAPVPSWPEIVAQQNHYNIIFPFLFFS